MSRNLGKIIDDFLEYLIHLNTFQFNFQDSRRLIPIIQQLRYDLKVPFDNNKKYFKRAYMIFKDKYTFSKFITILVYQDHH